jgi:hypothetical protein
VTRECVLNSFFFIGITADLALSVCGSDWCSLWIRRSLFIGSKAGLMFSNSPAIICCDVGVGLFWICLVISVSTGLSRGNVYFLTLISLFECDMSTRPCLDPIFLLRKYARIMNHYDLNLLEPGTSLKIV